MRAGESQHIGQALLTTGAAEWLTLSSDKVPRRSLPVANKVTRCRCLWSGLFSTPVFKQEDKRRHERGTVPRTNVSGDRKFVGTSGRPIANRPDPEGAPANLPHVFSTTQAELSGDECARHVIGSPAVPRLLRRKYAGTRNRVFRAVSCRAHRPSFRPVPRRRCFPHPSSLPGCGRWYFHPRARW